MFLAKVLYLLQPNTVKRVFGFDNFTGLPESTAADGSYAATRQGQYAGDEALLRAAIELFNLSEKIELVVGDAKKTIPQFQIDFPDTLISFAYLDFDLYEPTKIALDFIDESLVPGGYVVLDQAGTKEWPGETRAWLEHMRSSSSRYSAIANTISPQPTMAFQKLV